MTLNDYGKIVYEELFLSAKIRNEIRLYENEFVIMANHIHRIIILNEKISIIGANISGVKYFSLGERYFAGRKIFRPYSHIHL